MQAFVGLVAESIGDAVRDKAVAVLALALTSPSELTPQEAALAVEAAVFAHFAEQGKPALRSACPVAVAHMLFLYSNTSLLALLQLPCSVLPQESTCCLETGSAGCLWGQRLLS